MIVKDINFLLKIARIIRAIIRLIFETLGKIIGWILDLIMPLKHVKSAYAIQILHVNGNYQNLPNIGKINNRGYDLLVIILEVVVSVGTDMDGSLESLGMVY